MKLETPRLILREFVAADAPVMAAYWHDPRYRRFYPDYDDSDAFVHDLVATFITAQADDPRHRFQLAVTLRDDGRFIGNCGIRINNPELCEANIGYEINPACWSQGLATEAATAILDFGFDELQMRRVWAECVADNIASARVLSKLGMRQEARFVDHQWFRGRWWDTLIFAILDHERRDS
ncbi:MAG TPA: GNAT family N-acetyltransferase [Thermomicrobiales bacterium]|nr:GNAT family N-acetyltransferase [Thermomicrobiales bacterium]